MKYGHDILKQISIQSISLRSFEVEILVYHHKWFSIKLGVAKNLKNLNPGIPRFILRHQAPQELTLNITI